MLEFDTYGNLSPAGVHSISLAEARAILVDYFTDAAFDRRLELWLNLQFFNRELMDYCGLTFVQWINGSFATDKGQPGDVDVICFFPPDIIQISQERDQTRKLFYFFASENETAQAKLELAIDAYLVLDFSHFPKDDPARQAYEQERLYWKNWFGTGPGGEKKAIVELKLP
ncbi:MAG: DUF6932 family protein, partial [Bacteroidota bacterium]